MTRLGCFQFSVVGQGRDTVSRAFVNEDAGDGRAKRRIELPPRDDPGYDAAAAEALLENARAGDTGSAE